MTPRRPIKPDRTTEFDGYLSPFTWRYGSNEMRRLFSERERRAKWRAVWLALASAEGEEGLISPHEIAGIRSKAGKASVDVDSARRLERSIQHDLMAELRTFAAQAPVGGGKLHLGATSADIEDNADIAIYRRALSIIALRIVGCLKAFREKIVEHRDTVCMGWTHLQPAEPTTLGYRFANYAQDLVLDMRLMEAVRWHFLKGKGIKGAVGTSASFRSLLGNDKAPRRMEDSVMKKLGLQAFEVATQTYPRKVDYVLLSCLASIAQSCHKFGLDLRVMQSPGFGELSEPSADKQVGSSAMPFKRNPVLAERMCSLARVVSVLPGVAFSNAANSILERTLDDSASRRIAIPEAFLAVDECLRTYERVLKGLRVNSFMVEKNLARYGPFAATEAVLMKLTQSGEDRQRIHEKMRVASVAAWDEVMAGRPNPMESILASSKWVSSKLSPKGLHSLMDPRRHVGDAPGRCNEFLRKEVDPILAEHRWDGAPVRKSSR
jgi:adenylosuccinate lyase